MVGLGISEPSTVLSKIKKADSRWRWFTSCSIRSAKKGTRQHGPFMAILKQAVYLSSTIVPYVSFAKSCFWGLYLRFPDVLLEILEGPMIFRISKSTEFQLLWVMLWYLTRRVHSRCFRSMWRWIGPVPLRLGEPLVFGSSVTVTTGNTLMKIFWGAKKEICQLKIMKITVLVDSRHYRHYLSNLESWCLWCVTRCLRIALSERQRSLNHPGRLLLQSVMKNWKWRTCIQCWDVLKTFAERLMWGI